MKHVCSIEALVAFNKKPKQVFDEIIQIIRSQKLNFVYDKQNAIFAGIKICRDYGLIIPHDYGNWAWKPINDFNFSGKGIAQMYISNAFAHVVAFENDSFLFIDAEPIVGWKAYQKYIRDKNGGYTYIGVTKIFR